MPLFSIARFFTTLLSLAILAVAAWLLWSWHEGQLVRDAVDVLHREREPWRLWTGLGLLAWSFLGGRLIVFLLARPDASPVRADHGEGRRISTDDGGAIYVEAIGPEAAPPIILTHGWGMDSTFWVQAKRDLGDRFRLVLWDLPGLGRSKPAPKQAISLSAFARDLAMLVDELAPQRPVLVGHSIGGMTIQTLLRDHPQFHRKLAGIVLLNTTYTNPLETMILSPLMMALQKPVLEPAMKLIIALQPLAWLMNWQSYFSGSAHIASRIGFGRFVTRSQLEHATLLSTRNPPGAVARGMLAMFHWDATGVLAGSPVPVLVVGGDLDVVTKLEANRAIAASSPVGALEVVSGVNHMGPMERADLYNTQIADFALRVQPSATSDLDPPQPATTERPSRSGLDGSRLGIRPL